MDSDLYVPLMVNINNLRDADDTTLMAESRGTKESLDEGEGRD